MKTDILHIPDCTYRSLVDKGYGPSCPLQCRKVLTESEKGIKYILETSDGTMTASFDVDGYIVKSGAKCDKLVLASKDIGSNCWTEIFVELKGTDISHAIDQIRESLKNQIFRHPSNETVKARIVATSFPSNRSNPIMERARREFAAKPYFCELKAIKNGQKDCL